MPELNVEETKEVKRELDISGEPDKETPSPEKKDIFKSEEDRGSEPWWSQLPEAMQGRAKKFSDVSALAKSYMELEDTFHQTRKGINIPKEDADQSEWDNFYGFLRPRDSSKYELKDKEGKDLNPLHNEEAMTRLRKAFYDNGISTKQAKAMTEFLEEENRVAHALKSQKTALNRQGEDEALERKWGEKFEENYSLAQRVFQEVVPTKDLRQRFREEGYTSDPKFVELLGNIGKLISSDDSIKSLRTQDGAFKEAKSKTLLEKEYKELLAAQINGSMNISPHALNKRLTEVQRALGHDKD